MGKGSNIFSMRIYQDIHTTSLLPSLLTLNIDTHTHTHTHTHTQTQYLLLDYTPYSPPGHFFHRITLSKNSCTHPFHSKIYHEHCPLSFQTFFKSTNFNIFLAIASCRCIVKTISLLFNTQHPSKSHH